MASMISGESARAASLETPGHDKRARDVSSSLGFAIDIEASRDLCALGTMGQLCGLASANMAGMDQKRKCEDKKRPMMIHSRVRMRALRHTTPLGKPYSTHATHDDCVCVHFFSARTGCRSEASGHQLLSVPTLLLPASHGKTHKQSAPRS